MNKYCCNDMRSHIEHKCDVHDDVYECCDHLFLYNAIYDEYGVIIHDGGSSYIEIAFCPFCGHRFNESKRYKFFELLENELHYGDLEISNGDIPEEFKSDEWWRKRGL